MSIKPLPEDVVSRLRSSVIVTSPNEVVCGLLKNSLDASASKITVSVDYRRGNCSVEDNGLGIAAAEFAEAGGLCKLQNTSKYPPSCDVHGRYGSFLASVASLSLLSVTSRHHLGHSDSSLSIHHSAVIGRQLSTSSEKQLLSFPHGTLVSVRDLFGSMPVRVKQRALEADRSGTSKEFEQLVLFMISLLLSWPKPVLLWLRDTTSDQGTSLRLGYSSTDRRLSDKERVPRMLFQSLLLDDARIEDWVPIGVSSPGISVSGCVSLAPVASKRLQFISLGIEPLSSGIVRDDINKLFANSTFGATEEDAADVDRLAEQQTVSSRRELQFRKGIDRWPVFWLKIELSGTLSKQYLLDKKIVDDDRHSLRAIADLLQSMFYQFLKKHHFHPRRPQGDVETGYSRLSDGRHGNEQPDERSPRIDGRRADIRAAEKRMKLLTPTKLENSGSGSPAPGRLSRGGSPFSSWPRVKIWKTQSAAVKEGLPNSAVRSLRQESPQAEHSETPEISPLFDSTGRLLRKPFDDAPVPRRPQKEPGLETDVALPSLSTTTEGQNAEDDTFLWTNSVTRSRCVINSRTGFVIRSGDDQKRSLVTRQSKPSIAESRDASDERAEAGGNGAGPRDALSKWKNPVFEPPREVPIRKPAVSGAMESRPWTGEHGGTSHGVTLANGFEASSMSLQAKVSKAALEGAEVIAQVDRKFILVKAVGCKGNNRQTMQDQPDDTLLLLIDQHAADERCQLETLMRDYFVALQTEDGGLGPATGRLDRPIKFDLSLAEGRLLSRFRSFFDFWGVFCEVLEYDKADQAQKEPTAARVEVSQLPLAIIERCRQEPRLLIELLRKEIWRLQDKPAAATVPQAVGADPEDWFSRFHRCPPGIMDLLCSRSCRSAIMFNDALSHEQCVNLVRRLARCSFPFQCAHGRPSLVPLVDLSSFLSHGDADESEAGDFTQAFEEWKNRKGIGSEHETGLAET